MPVRRFRGDPDRVPQVLKPDEPAPNARGFRSQTETARQENGGQPKPGWLPKAHPRSLVSASHGASDIAHGIGLTATEKALLRPATPRPMSALWGDVHALRNFLQIGLFAIAGEMA
jgi:hypothetical protein